MDHPTGADGRFSAKIGSIWPRGACSMTRSVGKFIDLGAVRGENAAFPFLDYRV